MLEFYYNGAEEVAYGDGSDSNISINNYCSIQPGKTDTIECEGGMANLEVNSVEAVTIEEEQEICSMSFTLDGETVLEEDIDKKFNDLFELNSIRIVDGEGEANNNNDLIKICKMSSKIESITVENTSFSKDKYAKGDIVELTSGTAKITYSNIGEFDISKTREVDLITKQDKNGNDIDIKIVSPTEGNIADPATPYLTVEYGEGDLKKTAQIDVPMEEPVEVELEVLKTVYEYGETLDTENIKVCYKKVSEEEWTKISLKKLIEENKAIVSGFDSEAGPQEIIEQIVTVNLDIPELNIEEEKSFDVTIKDKITDITFDDTNLKKEYEYLEEELDLSGGKIIIQFLSGNLDRLLVDILKEQAEKINDSLSNIKGFDSSKYGEEEISLDYSYNDYLVDETEENKIKTFKYNITIKEGIKSVELNNDKITIPYGHKITNDDLANYKIIITTTNPDAEPIEIPVTPEMITKYDEKFINEEQSVAIQCSFEEIPTDIDLPFFIIVENYLDHIELTKNTVTILPETELDENVLTEEYKIIPVMANGDRGEAIQLTKDYIKGTYNINEEGSYKVKVEYLEKEADFTINVEDEVIGIRLDDDEKEKIQTKYLYGEKLKLNNAKLTIIKSSGHIEKIPLTENMIKTYNSKKIGNQELNIEYNNMSIEKAFEVEVENYLGYIELTKNEVKVLWGTELDENVLTEEYKIIPVMANGDRGEAIQLTKDYIEGTYNINEEGSYEVKVKHLEKKADFTIIVEDPITEIILEKEEEEKIIKEYLYEEELDLNNAQLTIIKLSGKENKIDLTKDMITNYNSKEVGIQRLNIMYNQKEIKRAFEVEVSDYVVDIILIKPDKTTYLQGEKLDLTGATVQVVWASGDLGEPVAVTFEMISGYIEGEMGTQRITVKYNDFEKTFDIIIGAQTGSSYINIYVILITIITISSIAFIAILTIDKKGRHMY